MLYYPPGYNMRVRSSLQAGPSATSASGRAGTGYTTAVSHGSPSLLDDLDVAVQECTYAATATLAEVSAYTPARAVRAQISERG